MLLPDVRYFSSVRTLATAWDPSNDSLVVAVGAKYKSKNLKIVAECWGSLQHICCELTPLSFSALVSSVSLLDTVPAFALNTSRFCLS